MNMLDLAAQIVKMLSSKASRACTTEDFNISPNKKNSIDLQMLDAVVHQHALQPKKIHRCIIYSVAPSIDVPILCTRHTARCPHYTQWGEH